MSKYVKNLITEDLRKQFRGVDDALLVNMVGLDANADNRLRGALLEKNIRVLIADDRPHSWAGLRALLITMRFVEVIAKARKKLHTR
jgi:hypothetical protein